MKILPPLTQFRPVGQDRQEALFILMKYGGQLPHCAERQRFKLLFCGEMRKGRVKLIGRYNC